MHPIVALAAALCFWHEAFVLTGVLLLCLYADMLADKIIKVLRETRNPS